MSRKGAARKPPSELGMRDVLLGMLKDPQACEVLGSLFDICDPDGEVLNVDNFASTAFACGRRSVGMEYRRMVDDVLSGGYERCRIAYGDYRERVREELAVKAKKEEEDG